MMERFRREVGAIENEAKHFIDDSFQTLRSAEGAFDMLQNFKHIRSRDAINSQMMRKFNDILLQFGKEVSRWYIYSRLYFILVRVLDSQKTWPGLWQVLFVRIVRSGVMVTSLLQVFNFACSKSKNITLDPNLVSQ